MVSTNDLSGYDGILIDISVQDQIVSALLIHIAGESGIVIHILQRAGNGSAADGYSGLKIPDRLAEEVFIAGICRYRQPCEGFVTSSSRTMKL